jgi:hypothetical protein
MRTSTLQSDETEDAVSVTSQLTTARASADDTVMVPETESIEPKPAVTKVNGLTMLEGKVIPKREASRIKGHFLTASRALLRSKAFTLGEKAVVIYLTDMLMDHELCWPSLDTIAKETGLPRSTAIRTINSLVKSGVVIRDLGGGRGKSTKYYLTQAVYPCQKNPAVLCDRASCQSTCSWSGDSVSERMTATEDVNSPNMTQFGQESDQNKQSQSETVCTVNSPSLRRFNPINSPSLTPEEKNNNSNEKEGGGKRSCPPGAGGPAPHPPLSIEMPKAESGSEHSQVKKLFSQLYEDAFGKAYLWQAQDGAILKGILKLDITLDEVKAAIENMFQDEWVVDKGMVSMKMFRSGINKYLPSFKPTASGQGSWDDTAIEVHTRLQPGEEPYPWPWPRTCWPRIDHDIPRKNQNRSMDEFSPGLVGRTHEWLQNENGNRGWSLTFTGTPGNGKSSLAGALLQTWRDHKTPELDSLDLDPSIPRMELDTRSQFITFESFKTNSYVTDTNPNTGWVGQSRIDADYIDNLVRIQFLVLDDLCSHEMEKVQYDALHNLLRLREQFGRMTVITTNKTITEIKDLIGQNVADRLRAGVILKFVDDSQRGDQVIQPSGLKRAADGIRMTPNPEMDPDKVNIPYVEPEPLGLVAAMASVGATLETIPAAPAITRRGGMNPPRPPWGTEE